MKNPFDVLRMKEQQIRKTKAEIEALKITAELLSEDHSPPTVVQRVEIPPLDFDAMEATLDTMDRRADPSQRGPRK